MAPIYIQIYFRMNSHFFSDENTLCVAINASVDHRESIQRYGFSALRAEKPYFIYIRNPLRSAGFRFRARRRIAIWKKESEGGEIFSTDSPMTAPV